MSHTPKEEAAIAKCFAARLAREQGERWFNSEGGIRAHYADEREAEAKRHADAMKRLNADELAFLEAFANRVKNQ